MLCTEAEVIENVEMLLSNAYIHRLVPRGIPYPESGKFTIRIKDYFSRVLLALPEPEPESKPQITA